MLDYHDIRKRMRPIPTPRYEPLPAEVETAFAAFTAANRKAQLSGAISDAIVAGKAWGRFLALFSPCRCERTGSKHG